MTMKVLAGAAVALLMMSGAAIAQTETTPAAGASESRCGAVPTAPTAPDAATVSASDMQAAVAEYETWRTAVETNLQCRLAEANELRAAADARATEYNAALNTARETGAAFQAATAAYNERAPRQRQVSRGVSR